MNKNKSLAIFGIIAGTLTLSFTSFSIFATKSEVEAKVSGIGIHMKNMTVELRIVRDDIKTILGRLKGKKEE